MPELEPTVEQDVSETASPEPVANDVIVRRGELSGKPATTPGSAHEETLIIAFVAVRAKARGFATQRKLDATRGRLGCQALTMLSSGAYGGE